MSQYDLPPMPDFVPNPKFVGRKEEIKKIHQYITTDVKDKQRICLVWGFGGLGKTQTVLQYTYTHISSYSAVIWIDATSDNDGTIQKSFFQTAQRYLNKVGEVMEPGEAAKSLHLTNHVMEGTSTLIDSSEGRKTAVQAMKEWLSRIDNNKWLLIFDGYDNIGSFSITKYFPRNLHGRIIITRNDRPRSGSINPSSFGQYKD